MDIAVQGLSKMPNRNFAIFILSHGRPDNVITYKTLRRQGYTGKIFIVVDNEDKTLKKYLSKYKDEVIIFDKKSYYGRFDIMDNFEANKTIVYARNACYDIARNLGLDYFFEYEDDYTNFQYKHIKDGLLKGATFYNFDAVLEAMIDCLELTKVDTIAFVQGGEFLGREHSLYYLHLKRKAMNTFLFKVNQDPSRDVIFRGRMNDDVNTYLSLGRIGRLFFQISKISMVQKSTQSASGGNTEAYKDFGTYVKSFYSILSSPDCCKIGALGRINMRIHHKINWENAVPKIIHEHHKKTE
jgi:hypothetical protein